MADAAADHIPNDRVPVELAFSAFLILGLPFVWWLELEGFGDIHRWIHSRLPLFTFSFFDLINLFIFLPKIKRPSSHSSKAEIISFWLYVFAFLACFAYGVFACEISIFHDK